MRNKLIILSIVLTGFVFSGSAAVVTNWVADPGFESLATISEPNSDTAPWSAVESDDWPVHLHHGIVHGGTNAVVYQYYGNTDTIRQDLPVGLTVDSSAIYECRFWMRLDEKSTNVAHTNDAAVWVMINTTTNGVHGSTYKWKATKYGVIPSAPYEWQEMVVHFRWADLSGRAGEYIRLSIKNGHQNSEYRVFIDDVQFGLYTPDQPDPSALIAYYGASGGTNDYTATGIDGAVFLDKAYGLNVNAGSEDGTFGSTTTGASLEYSAYEVRIGSDPTNNPLDELGFKIINRTGGPLQLDSICFDYAPFWSTSPEDVELLYTWGALAGVTGRTVIASASGITNYLGSVKGDYYDFDWSLAGLPDSVLAAGETAAFALKVSNAGSIWGGGGFDNIAILGSPSDAVGFDAWALDHNLTGGALDDDDEDGVDNLTEYAQNGDPKSLSDTGTLPMLGAMSSSGGTNWIEYVYLKRVSEDNGLTYSLVQSQDLVLGSWTNNGDIVDAGESALVGDFKAVTNRVPTDGKNNEFIRLQIEQD